MTITPINALKSGRAVYLSPLQARLALHRKLDLLIWSAMRRYLSSQTGDVAYWTQHCQPYINMLPEHNRLTQLTSHRLTYYGQHVQKLLLRAPRQIPTTKRARAFFVLVETWYWREYE